MSRPVGSKNKVGAQVKENIIAVFTRLGGTAEMAEWAGENKTEFYRMYCRLAPTDVTVEVSDKATDDMTDGEVCARIRDIERRLGAGAVGVTARAAKAKRGETEPSSVH